MRWPRFQNGVWRIGPLGSLVVPLILTLSFPALDFHRAVHEARDRAALAASVCDHPPDAPTHFTHAPQIVDRPCTACLFGLPTNGRLMEETSLLPRPAVRGAGLRTTASAAENLATELPVSRGPPLLL